MEALAAGGIPPPDVGFELASPEGRVVAEAELAWEAARVAVLLSPEAHRPFAEAGWRVFLHPSQRRLVERSWNGPVRVLGGAGTGKTVVAMHRARWLAKNLPEGKRILFTTFTRNLAADIEHNLRAICTPEEMRRIEVVNLDRWVHRLLRGKGYRFQLSFERHEDAWREAMAKKPLDLGLPDRFFRDEWEQVIQANGVESREQYLRVARTGRGVRLNRATRAEVWRVFEEYRAQLAERGVMEAADCYRAAAALLERERSDTGANPESRGRNLGACAVEVVAPDYWCRTVEDAAAWHR